MSQAQLNLGLGPTIAAVRTDLRVVFISATCAFLCLTHTRDTTILVCVL